MRGFEMASSEVEQFGLLHISGDVVPPEFFQAIKFENCKPDLLSVLILSNLLYWYRPIKPRDERTDHATAWRQKFQGEMLSRTYQEWADIYGATERQARDACHRLQAKGLITIFHKPCSTGGTVTYFVPVFKTVHSLLKAPTRLTPERESESNPTHVEASVHDDSRQNVSRVTPERESLNKERARVKINPETKRETSAPTVTSLICAAYESVATDYQTQMRLKTQIDQLNNPTPAQVKEWLKGRRRLPAVNFLAQDFKVWLDSQTRANVLQMPQQKKHACPTCQDSGSISVFENGVFARYADCPQCQPVRKAA